MGTIELTFKRQGIDITEIFYVADEKNTPKLGKIFLFQNEIELNYHRDKIMLYVWWKKYEVDMNRAWSLTIKNINSMDQGAHLLTEVKLQDDVDIRQHQQIIVFNIGELDNNSILTNNLELNNKKICHTYLSSTSQDHKTRLNIYNASNISNSSQGYVDWNYIQLMH